MRIAIDSVYDENYFGKPDGYMYIDDCTMRFSKWPVITNDVIEQEAQLR